MIPQDFNLDEYEIVYEPVPENETPRQFIQRMTGYDFEELEICTWEDIREHLFMQHFIGDIIARLRKPQLILRPKNANRQE